MDLNMADPDPPIETPKSESLSKILLKKPKQVAAAHLKSLCDEFRTERVPAFLFLLDIFDAKLASHSAERTANIEEVLEFVNFGCFSAEIKEKCGQFGELLDFLLGIQTDICSVNGADNVDLLKCFFAGGITPEDFAKTVQTFDNAVTCGLVWTPNFVAYRCRTCGLTPCMSLCGECFRGGNHEGHDFNMFRSQAGGACDCGDTNVMEESGFCKRHGPNAQKNIPDAPPDLLSVASYILPKIFARIIEHFRLEFHAIISGDGKILSVFEIVDRVGRLMDFLQNFSDMGAAAHSEMTRVLISHEIYNAATVGKFLITDKRKTISSQTQAYYKEALKSLPSICSKEDSETLDCPFLSKRLKHCSLLDELVFWLVRLDFPQKLVTFLLSMLPNDEYKFALADSFVMHYSRMAYRISRQTEDESMANRVIHISVQLLSNEHLSTRLVEKHQLTLVVVASLYSMIKETLIQSTFHSKEGNTHLVVNCGADMLENHNYWSLASDLHNILNHRSLATRFMRDPLVVDMWCNFLACFQGMNENERQLGLHVEFESRAYFASFTAELEACATTMWNLVQGCSGKEYQDCILLMLQRVQTSLVDFFEAIKFVPETCWRPNPLLFSFHLPLHRYYAAFFCLSAELRIDVPWPSELFMRQMVMHPIQIQVSREEINAGMWVRNGSTLRYQSCLYVQSHFCTAFHDMDLAIIQASTARVLPDWMILTIFERFHLVRWLSFAPGGPRKPFLRPEWAVHMVEGALKLLASIVTQRMNTGMSELDNTRLEIGTMLAMGDKTHSQLIENLPEKGVGSTTSHKHFEQVLKELAVFREPKFEAGGGMSQGMYTPKDCVWEKYFDPLHVMGRAIQTKDYQSAMDRYRE